MRKKKLTDYKWFKDAAEKSFQEWDSLPEEARQQYILDFLRKKAKEREEGDNGSQI